ncbi:hypothetical protein DSO57_1019306 [Entomophthora muscae]|uniref:Uncharacterized protein n=1 Tax=Entomophthora muscae TaxID=34485 RepID=A0ACC2RV29_9FUNG|nr:hypothetical protein DSO57_1019306 [Entomophthora muscae]
MLVPLVKFVAFTLEPALVMIWSTSPDLWSWITHYFHYIGANPNQFMYTFEDIPGWAPDMLIISENIVRSLTCDDLEFPTPELALSASPGLSSPMLLSSEAPVVLAPEEGEAVQESVPKCAPWLLGGMILMGLDSYFPQISAVSSLWTPLQEAVPVLHWMVSWWILPPEWEPNLVSLAPLSPQMLGNFYQIRFEYLFKRLLKKPKKSPQFNILELL